MKTNDSRFSNFESFRFQFLIGRLKTYEVVIPVGRYKKFQFLIGRLKTEMKEYPETVLKGFNSS